MGRARYALGAMLAVWITLIAAPVADASHSFTLAPGDGTVGTLITVMPSGIPGGQDYEVYWDYVSPGSKGTLVGGGTGNIATTFNAPAGAALGDHNVSVCNFCSNSVPHFAGIQRFRVTAPTPTPTTPPTPTPAPTATPKVTDTPPPSVTHSVTPTPMPSTPTLPPAVTIAPTPIGGVIAKTSTPKPPDIVAPGVEPVDLQVWAMEVTQGIQNLANDMPLVAERQTVVRVYVRTDGEDTFKIVKGALGAWRGANFLGVVAPDNGPILASQSGGDRVNVDDSLYFYLPPAWRTGAVRLKAYVYQGDVDSPYDHEPDAANNFFQVDVEFHQGKNAHVMLVPVHLHDTPEAGAPEHTYTWPENFGETIEIMLDIFRLNPVAKVYIYGGADEHKVFPLVHDVPLEQEGPTGPREWDLADPFQVQLPNEAIDVMADNTDPWVADLRWYGMVENDVTMKMQKQGFDPISLSGIAGFGRAYGKMSKAQDANSPWHISKAATIAHELAHKFMAHVNCKGTEEAGGGIDTKYPFPTPNCSIAEVAESSFMGFDVYYQNWPYLTVPTVISNDPGAADPNQAWPLMGYNSPKWTDPYVYCKMLVGYGVPCAVKLTPQIGLPRALEYVTEAQPGRSIYALREARAGVAASPTPADKLGNFEIQVLLSELQGGAPVARFINVGHTLDPRPHVLSDAEARRAQIEAEGLTSPVALSLEDADHAVLFSQPLLDMNATPHELEGEPNVKTFSELVPLPAGTAFIRVKRGDGILAERAVSANAPVVTLLSPAPRDEISVPLDIRWEASDIDGDILTFMVQYSADGGDTWRMIANGVHGNSLRLHSLAYLPGSENALFRVVANDGANTGADDSDGSVKMPNTAPTAAIYSPGDGATFARNALVILAASVTDWEDGPLSEASLRWESDLDGRLGQGLELQTRGLSPGRHRIRLVAADSAGAAGEAEIEVVIEGGAPRDLPSDEEMERLQEILQDERGGVPAALVVAIALIIGIALAGCGVAVAVVRRSR